MNATRKKESISQKFLHTIAPVFIPPRSRWRFLVGDLTHLLSVFLPPSLREDVSPFSHQNGWPKTILAFLAIANDGLRPPTTSCNLHSLHSQLSSTSPRSSATLDPLFLRVGSLLRNRYPSRHPNLRIRDRATQTRVPAISQPLRPKISRGALSLAPPSASRSFESREAYSTIEGTFTTPAAHWHSIPAFPPRMARWHSFSRARRMRTRLSPRGRSPTGFRGRSPLYRLAWTGE